MSLREKIMGDVKSAMKAREMDKLQTLRGVQAAIKNKEIESRPKELSEEDILAVLKKLGKQRKDSIEQFEKANREDLVAKEVAELKIIEDYLPEQMSEDQVREVVGQVIEKLGVTDMKAMGQVMKEVLAATGGTADNKIVSQVVREKLS